jgi:hypothetical protein
MIHHITFANADMSISGEHCSKQAIRHGCDTTRLYTPDDIDPEFRTAYDHILSEPRGAGYWLWKPYFFARTLATIPDGDYLVYTDAGLDFVNNVKRLIESMDSDIMVFGNLWRHGDWCRMDVLVGMGCERETDREQLQASCIIARKSPQSALFAEHWLRYATHERWITDDPSTLPNEPTFRENRHDQAILTNVAILHGLTWHWWGAQYSGGHRHKYPHDHYPQMFNHHRRRNNEWQK